MSKEMVAVVVALSWVLLATGLLLGGQINQVTFIALCGMSAASGFAVFGFDRLKSVDLKNLKITLAEIKSIRDEVYAKERDVAVVAANLCELAVFMSAFANRWGCDRSSKLTQEWVKSKANELMSSLSTLSPEQRSRIFRHSQAMVEMDREPKGEKRAARWELILDSVESEIAAMR